MNTIEKQRSTAIHEAGHLVINRRFGGEAAVARIYKEEVQIGGGKVVSWWNGVCEGTIAPRGTGSFFIGLAGIAAEYMYALDNDELAIAHIVNDEWQASEADFRYIGKRKISYKNVRSMVTMLREHWADVLFEADKLVQSVEHERGEQ